MRVRPARIAVVAVALVGAGAMLQWYAGQGAGPAPAEPAMAQQAPEIRRIAVEAAPVETDTVSEVIAVVGTLRSNESVVVSPEIAGRVAAIHFDEGEKVEAGAPLVELDASVYEAELKEARASLELSRRNFRRAEELFKKGVGTARQRDEARGQLDVDLARLALAEARLAKTVMRAPFGGVLGLRRVSVGEYVTPGQDIVNLEDITPVKVEFRIPETSVRAVRDGQTIEVELDAFPGRTFEGTVYAIDPRVDAAGRSFAVRARIPNEDRVLRPGLFARVRLIVEQRESVVVVPEIAIVPREGKQFVYRVVDGKAVQTEVTLGLRRNGRVEIVDGLSASDVIVTAGQIKLRDGVPVEVLSNKVSA